MIMIKIQAQSTSASSWNARSTCKPTTRNASSTSGNFDATTVRGSSGTGCRSIWLGRCCSCRRPAVAAAAGRRGGGAGGARGGDDGGRRGGYNPRIRALQNQTRWRSEELAQLTSKTLLESDDDDDDDDQAKPTQDTYFISSSFLNSFLFSSQSRGHFLSWLVYLQNNIKQQQQHADGRNNISTIK